MAPQTSSPDGVTKPLEVIPVIPEEFDDFETEALKFRRGEIEDKAFMGYRLKRGIYGQRQADVQMVRVKIPFGGLTSDQLDTLGRIAREYTPLDRGHVTTRENIQFHFVPLENATEIMRQLGEVGLTTREACGNAVRNVTGSPYAGVSKEELFDPTPYAGAFARYFVRKPFTQDMPRKFKVAFSSTESDDVIAGIHDIGFIPVIREIDGEQVKGFRYLVGGGLATLPRPAEELYDFVPVSDFLRVSEAILRVFNDSKELRKTRFKARIKFLVSWIGIDGLRERVEEELKKDWATEPIDPEPLPFHRRRGGGYPPRLASAKRTDDEPERRHLAFLSLEREKHGRAAAGRFPRRRSQAPSRRYQRRAVFCARRCIAPFRSRKGADEFRAKYRSPLGARGRSLSALAGASR